jgi:Adenylate and Guanylate cyclase catalytic domain
MVNSTELKYLLGPDVVFDMIVSLYTIVRDVGFQRVSKFTGDGAMVVFDPDDRGCERAASGALDILAGVEALNLSFRYPPMQVRIGIATGECLEFLLGVDDLTGKTPDLAARLCAEADRDEILVDEATWKNLSEGATSYRFALCNRRLSLKGVPPRNDESFYILRPRRLISTKHAVRGMAGEVGNAGGLLALYPGRDALADDFRPARIIRRAAPGTEVLVAGRTLVSWAGVAREMLAAVRERNIKFRLLLSHQKHTVLEERQRQEIAVHFPRALQVFRYLTREHQGDFDIRVTKQLLLDGVTCATLTQPSTAARSSTSRATSTPVFIALQDVNAAPGAAKAALLFGCTCGSTSDLHARESCMAHGLQKRSILLFEDEESIDVSRFRQL